MASIRMKYTLVSLMVIILLISQSAYNLSVYAQGGGGDADFLLFAEQTAQMARVKAWDSVNGGFYAELSRDWSVVKDSAKKSLGNTFYTHGLIYLFDVTGKEEYLQWARETVDVLLSRAWDSVNGGVFNSYDKYWNPTTSQKSLQEQADLLYVLIDLYERTGVQTYQDYATLLSDFIVSNYHDYTYGGNFAVFDQSIEQPSDKNKHTEISLGAFGWGMMRWYESSGEIVALTLTADANDFIWNHLYDPIYGGLMTQVSQDGSIIQNPNKYPNEEIWGLLGMLKYYQATGDSTTQGRIEDVLQHLRDTMWDNTYGGWYRSIYQDNTVRRETKDGWTQSEQPWFWWIAYQILGDLNYGQVAITSARWTRDHNYDVNYGGFFLELNRDGTLKLSAKDDWVQGGGIAAFALIGGALTSTITQSTTSTSTTTVTSSTGITTTNTITIPFTTTYTTTSTTTTTRTTTSATTVTSTVPTTTTISSRVTQTIEAVGPVTYGAVAVAVIATVAATILATRRRA